MRPEEVQRDSYVQLALEETVTEKARIVMHANRAQGRAARDGDVVAPSAGPWAGDPKMHMSRIGGKP